MKKVTKKEFEAKLKELRVMSADRSKYAARRNTKNKLYGEASFLYNEGLYKPNDFWLDEKIGKVYHYNKAGCRGRDFKKTINICLVQLKYGRGFKYYIGQHLYGQGTLCQDLKRS